MDPVGLFRNTHSNPFEVMMSAEGWSTTYGVLSRWATEAISTAWPEARPPVRTSTLVWVMSFSATVAASAFLAWWSSMMTSIFLPLTPPFALISSTAIPYAFLNLSPKGASGPVMGWGAPILSVSCATAGAVAAATRSIPDARLRTRLRRMTSASLHGDWVMGGETVESGRKNCQGWHRLSAMVAEGPAATSRPCSKLAAHHLGAFHEGAKLGAGRLP